MSLNASFLSGLRSNGRAKPFAPQRARLLMRAVERELCYARFEYDVTPKVPALLQPVPESTFKFASDSEAAAYWISAHSYARAQPAISYRKRPGSHRFGTAALQQAMQAKVRELMAARAAARSAEWHALARIAA